MNSDFWKNKNILITGHTGFKGSWLSFLLNHLGANISGLSLEKRKGIYEVLEVSKIMKNEYFFDITRLDKEDIKKIIEIVNPDIVFHLAAQSIVYLGYTKPLDTIETNIVGTYKIMDFVDSYSNAKSLIISTTDKVYLNSENDNFEEDQLGGHDFYSASKASSEFIISSYKNIKKNEHLNFTVIRSGNVIGGGDRADYRLIVELIESILQNNTFELRKPSSIRPWQFILDSLWGYLLAAEETI